MHFQHSGNNSVSNGLPAWGAFSHSARTAPVITVFTPVTALKTCHL